MVDVPDEKTDEMSIQDVDFNIFCSGIESFDLVESSFPLQEGFQKGAIAEEPEENDSEKCAHDDENFLHVNAGVSLFLYFVFDPDRASIYAMPLILASIEKVYDEIWRGGSDDSDSGEYAKEHQSVNRNNAEAHEKLVPTPPGKNYEVGTTELESVTSCMSSKRSNQLSYAPKAMNREANGAIRSLRKDIILAI